MLDRVPRKAWAAARPVSPCPVGSGVPGKVVSPRDVCLDTGHARLSYGQARALLDEHTARTAPARAGTCTNSATRR
ncbi:hypothetical protein GCM10020220_106750 [Nonomuraea rubra]